jgi:uncharacterized protein (TIGR02466 family)
MDINLLFATPIGVTKHPELVDSSRGWFEQVNLEPGPNPGITTSLGEYTVGKSKSLPISNSPALEVFKQTIIDNAVNFMAACGYATDKYVFKLANLWLNEMTSDSYQEAHSHYGNVVSGCFYVDVPEGSGSIVFTGPLSRIDKFMPEIENFSVFNSGAWTIMPEAGSMLLWESYLRHEVPKASFEGVRRSIAFDVSMETKG